jgi:hypothetical protein
MMEAFASSPHAERLFYVVDGHPNSGANEHIAAALERTLTSGAIPAFAGCRPRT